MGSSAAAAVLAGRLWVLGGTRGSRLRTVEVFDPRAGRWDQAPAEMCEARSAGQACVRLSHLHVVGGISEHNRIHRSMECYGHDSTGSFAVLRSMQEARMDLGCCGLNDMIMVSGGQNGEV